MVAMITRYGHEPPYGTLWFRRERENFWLGRESIISDT